MKFIVFIFIFKEFQNLKGFTFSHIVATLFLQNMLIRYLEIAYIN